jgi:hypothetical protein
MTVLESSQTPFAGAYTLILEAIQKLTEASHEWNEAEVAEIDLGDVQAIAKYLLTSAFGLPSSPMC